MLSNQAIEAYQQIYKESFGTSLSTNKAKEEAQKLVDLFKVVYRPIPTNWPNRHENERNICRKI